MFITKSTAVFVVSGWLLAAAGLFAQQTETGLLTVGQAITLLGIMVGPLGLAVAAIFKLLMAAKDKALADMTADRDDYRSMLRESTEMLNIATKKVADLRGETLPPKIAAVLAESHSVPSESQLETAEKATLRATITAATLALGEPARVIDSEPKNPAVEAMEASMRDLRRDVISAVDKTTAAVDKTTEAVKGQQ